MTLYTILEYKETEEYGLVSCFSCFVSREIALKYAIGEGITKEERLSFYPFKQLGGTFKAWLTKNMV